MNITKILKCVLALTLAITVLCLVGCKKDNEPQTSSSPTPSDTSDTSSVLVPVKATFPEQYTLMTALGDGDNINIKGNSALNVKSNAALRYDPISYEGIALNYSFKTSFDIGCGSKCTDFLNAYGVKTGYYTSYDLEGNAVDITTGGKKVFTVTAILSFDENDNSITYLTGKQISDHSEGIVQSGFNYIKNANIGVDLLIITLTVNGDLTVDSFDIIHYIV